MERPCVRRAAALTVLAALLAACGGDGGSDAPAVVEGTIVSLEYSAGSLRSFTVRAPDGETREVFVADDVSYGFDLDHLREHRADAEPVRCDVEERDGKLVAITIEDA